MVVLIQLKSNLLLGGGGRNFFIVIGDSLDDKEVGVRTNMGSWTGLQNGTVVVIVLILILGIMYSNL